MSESDALRPTTLGDYIGQPRLKAELDVQINAAYKQVRSFPHLLLAAPPGAGKTTLAALIAGRLSDSFTRLVMPVTERVLARHFQDCNGILLLDELHRMSRTAQESLLTVIEDGYFQLQSGRSIELEALTIIGATTEPHKIIRPLWDRFEAAGGVPAWEPYTEEDLAAIISGMAHRCGVDIDEATAAAYGRASAGTPRLGAKFVKRHADLAFSLGRNPTATETLEQLRMTEDGLGSYHLRYLQVLDSLGGKRGVETITSLLRLPASIVEDLEILLVTQGYIDFTPGGREITTKGTRLVRPAPTSHRGRDVA